MPCHHHIWRPSRLDRQRQTEFWCDVKAYAFNSSQNIRDVAQEQVVGPAKLRRITSPPTLIWHAREARVVPNIILEENRGHHHCYILLVVQQR